MFSERNRSCNISRVYFLHTGCAKLQMDLYNKKIENGEKQMCQKRNKEEDADNESCPASKRSKVTNNVQCSPAKPKKRLNIDEPKTSNKQKKFIYGNYAKYYGYRNMDTSSRFHDVRLDVFEKYENVFRDKDVLDIGCNCGVVTIEVAKRFHVRSIVGLDIDRHLIQQAIKGISKEKKLLNWNNENKSLKKFPFNVRFVHGNYVLIDDVLLEIEKPQFDLILCLSLTKWIHLHFGDAGIKQALRRMYLQLRPNGALILEAQSYEGYAKRKRMTEDTSKNYANIKFFPQDFNKYLLSNEVGFSKVQLMDVPDHHKKGFRRPIYIFYKE